MKLSQKITPFFSHFSLFFALILLYGSPLVGETTTPSSKEEATDFVRYHISPEREQLQTANITYKDQKGREITLIGAIHIADAAYYQALNELFKTYDVVLYELVGGPYEPEIHNADQQKSDDAKGASPMTVNFLHKFYGFLQDKLKLSFQLDEIDYTAKNFVHADVTHEQFNQLRAEKNEGFFSLWLKSMRAGSKNQQHPLPQIGILQLLDLMNRPGGELELKRLLGQTFDDVESLISGIEKEGETVILTERNRVLFSKLEEQLKSDHTKIGIFYGSAHFVDLEKRLELFGFKKVRQEWITAWDLPPASAKASSAQTPATSP